MSADGTINMARSSGVGTGPSGRLGPGDYQISFAPVDVEDDCAVTATVEVSGSIVPVSAQVYFTSQTQVGVIVLNSAGTLVDAAFDVQVSC